MISPFSPHPIAPNIVTKHAKTDWGHPGHLNGDGMPPNIRFVDGPIYRPAPSGIHEAGTRYAR